jgi:hypothetical protein
MSANDILEPVGWTALLIVAVVCFGEIASAPGRTPPAPRFVPPLVPPPEYAICVIEGCEYFRFRHYQGSYSLTHKGNCTNSIHSHNQ